MGSFSSPRTRNRILAGIRGSWLATSLQGKMGCICCEMLNIERIGERRCDYELISQ